MRSNAQFNRACLFKNRQGICNGNAPFIFGWQRLTWRTEPLPFGSESLGKSRWVRARFHQGAHRAQQHALDPCCALQFGSMQLSCLGQLLDDFHGFP